MVSGVRNFPLVYALACIVLFTACLYWAKAVLIPVALATLLTFLLNPVVSVLQRTRLLSRTPAVLLVVVLAFLLIGGVGWTVTRQLTALAYELPRYRENLKQKISDLRELGEGGVIARIQTTIKEVTGELQREAPPPPEIQPTGEPKQEPQKEAEKPVPVVVQGRSVFWQLPSLLEPLATVGLVIVLVIFMLVQYSELRSRLIRLAGYGRLTIATKALDEAGQRISRYLLMQSIINGSFGLVVGLGLFLIGVPYAILWGFLAGVLRFIPYVGPIVSAFLPSALSLAVFPGWVQPVMVIGLILILELASNMVMEPLLYGQSAGVSEVALLVAVAFWTWLWGAAGLLLATPMTVCLGVLSKHIPQLEFIGILLSDEPALEPSTNFYQRLVAEDQDEAAALVDEYLETHTLEETYDEVLIPALNALKRDRDLGSLTEEDVGLIIQATRAIVEDLGTHPCQPSISMPTVAEGPKASAETPPSQILGCPAQDEVDELALLMLRQLLDPTRYTLEIVSTEVLTAEVLSVVEQHRIELICISSLPPSPLAPTRYLCKRLRARFPECKLLVGRWGRSEDWDKPQALLREAGADEVGTTLRETHNQVTQWSQLVSTTDA